MNPGNPVSCFEVVLLDANVLSELMKAPQRQHAEVKVWTKTQQVHEQFVSSFTLSEIYQGIYALPGGKRRNELYRSLKNLEQLFSANILNFDRQSAEQVGVIWERIKKAGLPMDQADLYTLAVAERYNLSLVTRNLKHFRGRTSLSLINPFDD